MSLSISNIGSQSFSPGDVLLIQQIDDLFRGAQDPATVFPRFDELAGELISYDRITIGIYTDSWPQAEIAYAARTAVSTCTTGYRDQIQVDDLKIWATKRQPITDLTADARP